MSREDLGVMYRKTCAYKQSQSDSIDMSEELWNVQVEQTIKLPFLEKMLEVFQSAVHERS